MNPPIARPAHCTALTPCPCPPVHLWDFGWEALGEEYSVEIQGCVDGERELRKAGREERVPREAVLACKLSSWDVLFTPLFLPFPNQRKSLHFYSFLGMVEKKNEKQPSHITNRQCNVM